MLFFQSLYIFDTIFTQNLPNTKKLLITHNKLKILFTKCQIVFITTDISLCTFKSDFLTKQQCQTKLKNHSIGKESSANHTIGYQQFSIKLVMCKVKLKVISLSHLHITKTVVLEAHFQKGVELFKENSLRIFEGKSIQYNTL